MVGAMVGGRWKPSAVSWPAAVALIAVGLPFVAADVGPRLVQPGLSAVVATVVPPPPAGAILVVPLRATTMTDHWTGEGTVRATVRLRGLVPGTYRRLEGLAVAGAPSQAVIAMGHKLTCGVPGGPTTQQLWNGTNLVAGRPDATVHLRMFVLAPPGGALDCHLRLYLTSHVGIPDPWARLRGGWLADRGGYGRPPSSVMKVLATTPNPIFRPGEPSRVVASLRYTPPAGAKTLVLGGDVYVTECHGTDHFCPPGTYRPAGWASPQTSVQAIPARAGCPLFSSVPVSAVVDGLRHHQRLENSLMFRLPAAACGPWTIRVIARSRPATNPFVISTSSYYSDILVAASSV
jgi:hypothetical protein